MGMPRNLVLVRHSSRWRLSEKGKLQAASASEWIESSLGFEFDRCYVSEYLRAMETAGLLGIKHASWFVEMYLRERDWGLLDRLSVAERDKKFAEAMREREVDSLFWVPPGGQSMADLCLRIDRVIQTLHRECDGKNVIIVCHGEVMWAFRLRLERMSQERFLELDASRDHHDRIHNCQILHYTRARNLGDCRSSNCLPYLWQMRSICPWDTSLSSNEWTEIVRKKYTSEELLERASRFQPLVSA